jgi:hypothetical protein
MESFWSSMQIELLNKQKWLRVVELSTAMADYIENFHNQARRHSSIAYLTPTEYEALHLTKPRPDSPKRGPSIVCRRMPGGWCAPSSRGFRRPPTGRMSPWSARETQRKSRTGSGTFDFKSPVRGVGDCLEIIGIRSDHNVMAPERSLDDSRVDYVGGAGPSGQNPDGACLVVVHRFDVTADEKPGQEGLA